MANYSKIKIQWWEKIIDAKKRRNNGKSKIDYKSTLEKYRLDENIDEKKAKVLGFNKTYEKRYQNKIIPCKKGDFKGNCDNCNTWDNRI